MTPFLTTTAPTGTSPASSASAASSSATRMKPESSLFMAAHISGYRKNSRRVRNTPLSHIVLLVMHAGHYVTEEAVTRVSCYLKQYSLRK
jgi:hypothetical protein